MHYLLWVSSLSLNKLCMLSKCVQVCFLFLTQVSNCVYFHQSSVSFGHNLIARWTKIHRFIQIYFICRCIYMNTSLRNDYFQSYFKTIVTIFPIKTFNTPFLIYLSFNPLVAVLMFLLNPPLDAWKCDKSPREMINAPEDDIKGERSETVQIQTISVQVKYSHSYKVLQTEEEFSYPPLGDFWNNPKKFHPTIRTLPYKKMRENISIVFRNMHQKLHWIRHLHVHLLLKFQWNISTGVK